MHKPEYLVYLILRVYKFTGNEIGKFKDPQKRYHNDLPEYCVRKDTGKIDRTEHYLQFVDRGKDVYYLIDYIKASPLLEEEINNVGFEGIFGSENFKNLIKHATIITYDKYYKMIPEETIFVIELTYTSDMDLEYIVKGFLDSKFQLKPVSQPAEVYKLNSDKET